MKLTKLKFLLLTATFGLAVASVDSASAANTTTNAMSRTGIGKNPAVLAIRDSIVTSNQEFRQQQRQLHQELKAAPKSERAAIRAEIRQNQAAHRAEMRTLTQSLRTEIRSLRRTHTTTTTTGTSS